MERKLWKSSEPDVSSSASRGSVSFSSVLSNESVLTSTCEAWATSSGRSSKTVAMNYENYEDAIMQGRRVKLVGYPFQPTLRSPSSIGNIKDMCTLHDGWMTGSIRWVRMTNDEVKLHAVDLEQRRAAGETVGKKRKRRSPNKKSKSKRAKDADESETEVPEPKKPAKRAKRTLKSQIAPKSKAAISDSGSGSDE